MKIQRTNPPDDVELVPIPMRREARRRLVAFARAVGKPETEAAALLLDDLLHDDEFWNAASDVRSLN